MADGSEARETTSDMIQLLLHPLTLSLSAWRPFVTPAPLWDYWWLLLFPLLASVAIVYKCTKVSKVRRVPGEAGQLWLSALVAMIAGAGLHFLLVYRVLG